MNTKLNIQIRKFLYGILLAGLTLSLCLGTGGWSPAHAQAADTQTPSDAVVTSVSTATDIPVATATEAPTETLVPAEPTGTPMPATTATEVPTENTVPPESMNPQAFNPDNVLNSPAGAQRAPDGSLFMPGGTQQDRIPIGAQSVTALTTGGPDDFGYTWDNSGAVNWIDTSSGNNTGITGSSYDKAVGPVSLPFSFKYYENTYTNLYIAASGYLSFTNNNGNWPGQESIPSPSVPNNVIAPYWVPMNIGTGSWIHYTSGGSAPNRYFVIEWHDVKDAYSGNQYSFEGILQENGNIIFQYQTMTYNGGYECGASGIEDSTGLDGLSYVGFCNQASSNTAVLFTRPAPAVRISVHPTDQGHFTVAGGLESFSLPIRNTGDLGADTFDITLNSTWSASLYASDGSTLLINTDTDGTVDTGPVSQGNTATVIVKVQTPGTAVLGDSNIGMLTIRSKIDTGVSKTITLKTAIPAPFVQAFEDNSDGAMHMNLVQPHGQTAEKVTGDYYWGNNDAIARASGDNYIYAWSRYGYSNNRDHYNIEYTLLDHAGNTLKPTIKLSNNSSATYDTQPAVAVTPDGHIGIVWTRKSYNNNYSQFIYNVFFAILDGTGKVVLSPTNITNNSAWGIWSSLNVPTYARPQISATGDNRFFLAWESDYNVSTGAINDVDFAVRNSLGGQILAAAPFVSGNPNGGPNFIEPSLTSLSSDRVFLSWESRQNGNDAIQYAVLASDGSVVKGDTNLSVSDNPINWQNWDAAQLPNGKILAVWEAWGCFPGEWVPRLSFAILDSSYTRIGNPQCLNKSTTNSPGDNSASVTASETDDFVITWSDTQSNYLNYALLDSSGSIVTQPMIFLKSNGISSTINTTNTGYGNAPYDLITPVSNDDISTPVSITSIPYTNTQDTTLATTAGDDPAMNACNLAPGLASVWYQYTPSSDLSVNLDTLGSNYDTILAIWTGSRGNLSPVACNNDSGGTPQSAVQADLTGGTTYYFEVAQYNGSALAPLSQDVNALAGGGLTFHAAFIPTLVTPPAGAALLNNRPTFDWTDLSNAVNYNLQISKNTTFTSLIGNYTVVPSNYTPAADLPANLTLYWRVRAKYLSGYSPWSIVNSLHTANPPGIPSLVAPANNALTTNLMPLLDWASSSVPSGAPAFDHYLLQVNDSAEFSSPLINQIMDAPATNSSFSPLAPLSSNTTYSWRVQACNTNSECSAWSAVRTFRTALPPPISLAEEGSVQDLRPNLSWDMPSYPNQIATGYTVQVSKNNTFTLIVATGSATVSSYTPTADLPHGLTLYWHVRANGANGPSAWSDYDTYITGNPPSTPTLSAPASNALTTNYTPLLDWSNSSVSLGAPAFDHYQLQVDANPDFLIPLFNQSVDAPATNSNFTPLAPLDPNTNYSWRVQACNINSECSAWSAVRTFRTALPPPISLAEDGSVQDLRPNLSWDMSSYPNQIATGYTVQVSKNNTFTQIVATGSATPMNYTPTADLPHGLTLYWHVRANGANGPSAWSGFDTYITGTPPGTPTLSAPASNALVTSYTPLLDWSNSSVSLGAPAFDHYQLQVDANPDFLIPLFNQSVDAPATNSSFTSLTPLDPNTKYSWRVHACNINSECSTWSAVRTFRTKLSAPLLSSPLDTTSASNHRPSFNWDVVPGSTSYTIQVTATNFVTDLVNKAVTPLTYTPTADLPTGTLSWRVRANGTNGPSDWSTVWTVTIP